MKQFVFEEIFQNGIERLVISDRNKFFSIREEDAKSVTIPDEIFSYIAISYRNRTNKFCFLRKEILLREVQEKMKRNKMEEYFKNIESKLSTEQRLALIFNPEQRTTEIRKEMEKDSIYLVEMIIKSRTVQFVKEELMDEIDLYIEDTILFIQNLKHKEPSI